MNFRTCIACALTALFFFAGAVSAQTVPGVAWARQAEQVSPETIIVDSAGNSYMTGLFRDTAVFGSYVLTGHSLQPFLAKYDPSGNVLWARKTVNNLIGYPEITGFAVDLDGNSYLAGKIDGVIAFGADTLTNQPFYPSSYLAKYDTAGNLVWFTQMVSQGGGCVSRKVKIDQLGNCVMQGVFNGSITFGSSVYSSSPLNSSAYFNAVFTTNGVPFSFQTLNSNFGSFGIGNTITSVKSGDTRARYVSGGITNSAVIGQDTLVTQGSTDLYVGKLDTTGNFLWGRLLGCLNMTANLATDEYDNLYVFGNYAYAIDFGSTVLLGNGQTNVGYVAKYDPAGNLLWAHNTGTYDYWARAEVYPIPGGDFYLYGTFTDTLRIGNFTLSGYGIDPLSPSTNFKQADLFLARYNGAGNVLWAMQAGSKSFEDATDLFIDNAGNCYLTGTFSDSLDLNGIMLHGDSVFASMFIAKLGAGIASIAEEAQPEQNQLQLSPNPNSGVFTAFLTAASAERAVITLTDLSGRTVSTQAVQLKAGANQIPFSLSEQAPGMYLMRVNKKDQTLHSRIVKQ